MRLRPGSAPRDAALPQHIRREELAVAGARLRQAIERDVGQLGLGPAMYASSLEHQATVILDLAGRVHAILGRERAGSDYVLTATTEAGTPWVPSASGEVAEARRVAHHQRLVAAVVGEIERLELGPSARRVDRAGRLRIYDRDRRVHAVIGVWPAMGPEEVAQTLYGVIWPPHRLGSYMPTVRQPHAYDEHPLTLAVERWIEARGASVVRRSMSSVGHLELTASDGAPTMRIGVSLTTGRMEARDEYGARWLPAAGVRWCTGVARAPSESGR